MVLSDRLELISVSKIRKLFDLAQGIEEIIPLGIGEPDFDTPEHIKEYAKKALDKRTNTLWPKAGLSMFREAVAEKLKKDNRIEADSKTQIMITVGSESGAFNESRRLLKWW